LDSGHGSRLDDAMTYRLLIADKSYSSWSLRGWLSFHAFDIACEVQSTRMYCDDFARDLAAFTSAPARTVPLARAPEGGLLTDSFAIAWHLSEAFPDRGLLPSDPVARADAQSLMAEMHSGFSALRSDCPMNLRTGWAGFGPSDAVLADLARVEALWARAFAAHGGPWLCGDYSLADVFYAPLATRVVTYGLPVSDMAAAYISRHLDHPAFARWRAAGLAEGPDQPNYEIGLPRRDFALS
jgi:glutathione S-transferase